MLKEILENLNENDLLGKVSNIFEDVVSVKKCCDYVEILVGMPKISTKKAIKEIETNFKNDIEMVQPIYKVKEKEALKIYQNLTEYYKNFLEENEDKNFEDFQNNEYVIIYVKKAGSPEIKLNKNDIDNFLELFKTNKCFNKSSDKSLKDFGNQIFKLASGSIKKVELNGDVFDKFSNCIHFKCFTDYWKDFYSKYLYAKNSLILKR